MQNLEHGIYAVQIRIGEKWYKGALHFGPRPALKLNEPSFEIHVIDFNKEIYGEEVEVIVLDKIRGVMNFASLEELKEQIAKDVQSVKMAR